MIGGWRPLLPDILSQSDRVAAKSPISDLFSLVARLWPSIAPMCAFHKRSELYCGL